MPCQARQDGVDRQGIIIVDPAVGRLGRLKEGDGYDMVGDGIALFPPGTCTDHLPKMAGRFRHRDAVAGFSRPWWLRCLLPAGRSAQPMRTCRGLNARARREPRSLLLSKRSFSGTIGQQADSKHTAARAAHQVAKKSTSFRPLRTKRLVHLPALTRHQEAAPPSPEKLAHMNAGRPRDLQTLAPASTSLRPATPPLLPRPAPALLDQRDHLDLMLRHRATPSACPRTCGLQPT